MPRHNAKDGSTATIKGLCDLGVGGGGDKAVHHEVLFFVFVIADTKSLVDADIRDAAIDFACCIVG